MADVSPNLDLQKKTNMATGALSHLIGAYYLLSGLACDCDPKQDESLRQVLLHGKGVYWAIMFKKFGIRNPKRPDFQTRELDVSDLPEEYKPIPKRPGAKFDMSNVGGL